MQIERDVFKEIALFSIQSGCMEFLAAPSKTAYYRWNAFNNHARPLLVLIITTPVTPISINCYEPPITRNPYHAVFKGQFFNLLQMQSR